MGLLIIQPRFVLQRAVAEYDASGNLGAFDLIGVGEKQHGRIVSIAAIKQNLDVSAWDALDAAGWGALITSNDMQVLGPVTGELTEPTEVTSPGDGHLAEIHDGEDYNLSFGFYNPDDNMALAEQLNKQSALGQWSVMVVFYDMTGYIYTTNDLELVPVKYRLRPHSVNTEINGNRRMTGNLRFMVQSLPKVLKNLPVSVFKKN